MRHVTDVLSDRELHVFCTRPLMCTSNVHTHIRNSNDRSTARFEVHSISFHSIPSHYIPFHAIPIRFHYTPIPYHSISFRIIPIPCPFDLHFISIHSIPFHLITLHLDLFCVVLFSLCARQFVCTTVLPAWLLCCLLTAVDVALVDASLLMLMLLLVFWWRLPLLFMFFVVLSLLL